MNEVRSHGTSIHRGELRLFSVVSLWLVLASLLAPASLQGCQDHTAGLGPVTWAGSVGVTGAALSADRAPGDSQPGPSDGDHGDRCCCPAPCNGCATGFTAGSVAADWDDRLSGSPGSEFPGYAGPVGAENPFFLPFAIPPPSA